VLKKNVMNQEIHNSLNNYLYLIIHFKIKNLLATIYIK
jgi:hypothetical protein